MSEAQALFRSGDAAAGDARLRAVEQQLAAAPGPAGGEEARGRAELARLAPEVQRRLRGQVGDTSRMWAVLAFVQEKMADTNYAAAMQALA